MKITKANGLLLKAREIGALDLSRGWYDAARKWHDNPAFAKWSDSYAAIDNWLKDKQGRATERTVTRADLDAAINAVIGWAESLRVPVALFRGAAIVINPHGQVFPRAYRYTPMASVITITIRKSGEWAINVTREDCKGPTSRLPHFRGWIPDGLASRILDGLLG